MADAFSSIFGEETKKPASGGDLVAPKKSPFANVNSQLQAEDDFDVMLSNAAKQPKQPQQPASSQPNPFQRSVATALESAFKARDIFRGAVAEPVATLLTGAQAPIIGGITGKIAEARSPQFGTPQGRFIAEQQAKNYAEQTTFQPRTETGKAVVGKIGEVGEKLASVGPLPELYGFSPLALSAGKEANALFKMGASDVGQQVKSGYQALKAELPTVRIERAGQKGMQSGGAAATTNQAVLNEAINRASPELAAELKTIDPATVNPQVLENYVKADKFGIKLTKGQATGDPNLISVERNERGLKPQLAEEYAKQNRALAEKAEEIKQKTAEGTFEPDYVANSERAIESFQQINKDKQAAIKTAYDDLEKLGAGKIEVDSKTFGENAMKALTANEDIDFLPPTIKAKIEAYQGGKPMNFAQYENLRTQISRETRKAQRADDGNAVHALTIARSELEKLPLLNETADAKIVADKARKLAAEEFGLLDKRRDTYNPVYADIVNGSADTSNFIPKVVIRSKNADFAKAMDMLKDNPDAIKQLRAGTLDYIISKSKDASGNFSNAKFNQFVGNLDVNKKLTALFGEDATQIKDLADVARLIEAQPKGSFVSTANTAPAAAQLAKEYGLRMAKKTPLVGGLVEPAMQIRAERQMAKEVQETLRPGAGAGTKLKNLGKD